MLRPKSIETGGARMGISLTSIHIFGTTAPEGAELSFRSFSPGWLTCVKDLSGKTPDDSYQTAKRISREIDAPVLYFGVFDSETIWLSIFCGGKLAARYSDEGFPANKKLSDIPAMTGCAGGSKKRFSEILACADTDLKISMLEELFGVCLCYEPEMPEEGEMLRRDRGDAIYRAYHAEEQALTGKAAPLALRLIAEYPGKLFTDVFGKHDTIKPHFFLYGYTADKSVGGAYHALTPVRFTGRSLEAIDPDTFAQGRIPYRTKDPRFTLDHGTPGKVTFSEECPPEYRGKTMALPNWFDPVGFLPTGELLLRGVHRIYVADPTFKIIAKLSHKGEIADLIGGQILTTTGDSFCGYCYEPGAKIYIYEVVDKRTS